MLSEQKKIHGYNIQSDYAVLRKWQREDDWDFKEDYLAGADTGRR